MPTAIPKQQQQPIAKPTPPLDNTPPRPLTAAEAAAVAGGPTIENNNE